MKTVKEWFESVQDETLRNELLNELTNIFGADENYFAKDLHDAIRNGISMKYPTMGVERLIDILDMARLGQIETALVADIYDHSDMD